MKKVFVVSLPEISYSLAFTYRHEMEEWARDYRAFALKWEERVNDIFFGKAKEEPIPIPEKFQEIMDITAKKYYVEKHDLMRYCLSKTVTETAIPII